MEIQTPFAFFRDTDGTPLDGGYVYIGTENQEPITNPVNVYWDEARTILAAQPIRTLGGYPVHAGAPANVYVGSNYSITAKNKSGELVVSLLRATSLEANLADGTASRGAGMVDYSYSSAYAAGTVGKELKDRKDATDGLETRATDLETADALLKILAANAQCRLVYTDETHVTLQPYNGNKILINGSVQTIPAAGVALASTGLLANTLYYVYAYMNGTTMTLEAVTTGHSTNATTGVEIKTGDVLRTLVGMVYCPLAATFYSNIKFCMVKSWFNRNPCDLYGSYTLNQTITSTTGAEPSIEIRVKFLCWADELVSLSHSGKVSCSASAESFVCVKVDDNTGSGNAGCWAGSIVSTTSVNLTCSGAFGSNSESVTEGYHYATLVAGSASGTLTLYGTGVVVNAGNYIHASLTS